MAAITREAIWEAADELEAEGAKPTLNAVRKKLGGGSFTTISATTVWMRPGARRSGHWLVSASGWLPNRPRCVSRLLTRWSRPTGWRPRSKDYGIRRPRPPHVTSSPRTWRLYRRSNRRRRERRSVPSSARWPRT